MEKPKNTAAFGKLRFDWKRRVNEDANLSRGAKQMACCLCDSFVNKETGRCWPKNATLAKRLGVDKRTVQRYIKMLEPYAGSKFGMPTGRTRSACPT